jgi:hypothetical protein
MKSPRSNTSRGSTSTVVKYPVFCSPEARTPEKRDMPRYPVTPPEVLFSRLEMVDLECHNIGPQITFKGAIEARMVTWNARTKKPSS